MLYRDSGPTGALGTDSFPGLRAVTQGPEQGQPRWQLAGHQHTRALLSFEPGRSAPGSALASGRGWDGERKALAPGGLGLNPASVSPSIQERAPSPCLLTRLVQRCSEFIRSTPWAAPAQSLDSVNISHYCCGCPDSREDR